MTKTHHSPFMRVATIMAIVCLIFSFGICGALAKYTSAANGSDSVSIAKWSIDMNGTEIAKKDKQTFAFNLWDTIYDSNGTDNETDVHTDLIAPGTCGSMTFKISNNSEVSLTYVLSLTETNAFNIPVEYSLDPDSDKWYGDMAEINASENFKDKVLLEGNAQEITIYWRWVYSTGDEGDVADTLLGIAGQGTAPSVTIAASLVATQNN